MRIVEDIKQEYFGFKFASLASILVFALMLGCLSNGEGTSLIFGCAFLAGYILLVVAAVNNRKAVERDLGKYIQIMLDGKMASNGAGADEHCKVVRAQSHIFRYYIYTNEYVTKEDVDYVMDECYTQTKIRMRYRYVKCKEDEYINNLVV